MESKNIMPLFSIDGIGELIKTIRRKRKLSQEELSALSGLSRAYIGRIETGSNIPALKAIRRLSEALNYDLLNDVDNYQFPNSNDAKDSDEIDTMKLQGLIPIIGELVAGIQIENNTDIVDFEEVTKSMAKSGDYFALRVKGNCMYPKIEDGDIAIVKKQDNILSGQIAVITVGSDNAIVRLVRKHKDGITLIGYNLDMYEPHVYTNQDIENLPIKIIGVVVELRRKYV